MTQSGFPSPGQGSREDRANAVMPVIQGQQNFYFEATGKSEAIAIIRSLLSSFSLSTTVMPLSTYRSSKCALCAFEVAEWLAPLLAVPPSRRHFSQISTVFTKRVPSPRDGSGTPSKASLH